MLKKSRNQDCGKIPPKAICFLSISIRLGRTCHPKRVLIVGCSMTIERLFYTCSGAAQKLRRCLHDSGSPLYCLRLIPANAIPTSCTFSASSRYSMETFSLAVSFSQPSSTSPSLSAGNRQAPSLPFTVYFSGIAQSMALFVRSTCLRCWMAPYLQAEDAAPSCVKTDLCILLVVHSDCPLMADLV